MCFATDASGSIALRRGERQEEVGIALGRISNFYRDVQGVDPLLPLPCGQCLSTLVLFQAQPPYVAHTSYSSRASPAGCEKCRAWRLPREAEPAGFTP